MNKTFKKILSVCCTVVTTLTATLFRSTEVQAYNSYRIFFIGESGVGKTQLVNRIDKNEFSDDYKYTIVAGFFIKNTTASDSLQLWDTVGKESWRECNKHMFNRKAITTLYCCSWDKLESQTSQCLLSSFDIPDSSTVMLCITKEDTINQSDQSDDDAFNQKSLEEVLTQLRQANAGCNILSEILVTSAKTGTYKLCKPETYDSTDYKNIHTDLAEDLVTLCKKLEQPPNTGNADATKNTSLDDIDNRSYGKKPTMDLGYCLGVSIGLGSVVGFGFYGHDRNKKKKAVNHPTGKHIQNEKKEIKKLLNN